MKTLVEAVKDDLVEYYRALARGEEPGGLGFYSLLLSSNPKAYPASGLQHFLGSGFIAARLASFLGLGERETVVAFLAGVLHDLHKLGVPASGARERLYTMLAGTSLFKAGVLGILKDSGEAEKAFLDAIEVALNLWRGYVPRKAQNCILDIVAVSDVLSGDPDSWSLSRCMERLVKGVRGGRPLCSRWVEEANLLPVYIGRPRPLATLLSELVEEKLEGMGAVPLISTPEGMLFLVEGQLEGVGNIYRDVADDIITRTTGAGDHSQTGAAKSRLAPCFNCIAKVIKQGRKLATCSRSCRPVTGYNSSDLEQLYGSVAAVPDDLRLLVVALAYIYSKDPKSGKSEASRISDYITRIGVSITDAGQAKEVMDMLEALYSQLGSLGSEELKEVARRAVDIIKEEMEKSRSMITPELLAEKLKSYVSIAGAAPTPTEPTASPRCSVCRDPVPDPRPGSLKMYLDIVKRNAIKDINTSDVFHPDSQGKPEKHGSIGGVGVNMPVCGVCILEASLYREIGHLDGLWAFTLVYYPSMPVDLLKAIKGAVREVLGQDVRVLSDYLTSRIIIPTGEAVLRKGALEDAINLWYTFGGNLVVTMNAVGSAFTWEGMPVELDITDTIIEEAVGTYMEILKNIKKYGWFTRSIRGWLYRLLKEYLKSLDEKQLGTTSLGFSRSAAPATGYPTVDVLSSLLKKLGG